MEMTDLEIGPEMTAVVRIASIVGEEVHHVRFCEILRILLDEFCATHLISFVEIEERVDVLLVSSQSVTIVSAYSKMVTTNPYFFFPSDMSRKGS